MTLRLNVMLRSIEGAHHLAPSRTPSLSQLLAPHGTARKQNHVRLDRWLR